ncbi:unnamed protein product [Effrenium voratum]|uniref:Uncharacterized protein n=1 Tax=Effrenium voratum TaxID=2562239 RepID=A0AA36JE91_9DINO|nr:unnamed protein product [Effrenium voratum]CAJ1417501.1 unnamed protein product [Effrenium voratum]
MTDGEEGDRTVPREFRELPDHHDSFDDELPKEPKEEPKEVLIEDLTPDVRSSAAVGTLGL